MVVVNNVGTREEDLTHKKYRIWYLRDRSQRSLACKLQSDWQAGGAGALAFQLGSNYSLDGPNSRNGRRELAAEPIDLLQSSWGE